MTLRGGSCVAVLAASSVRMVLRRRSCEDRRGLSVTLCVTGRAKSPQRQTNADGNRLLQLSIATRRNRPLTAGRVHQGGWTEIKLSEETAVVDTVATTASSSQTRQCDYSTTPTPLRVSVIRTFFCVRPATQYNTIQYNIRLIRLDRTHAIQ